MTDIELVIDLHKNSERQGPGSEEETLKALGFIPLPNNGKLQVADIGCGSGGQTITLARSIHGHITAIDLSTAFLEELKERSKAHKLDKKISAIEMPMEDLQFKKESFDIIWSEGAIYNMGFENGIKKWRNYLKPLGYLAVSEITWITNTRPREIEDFWSLECPEINTASHNIRVLENNGYSLVAYFHLSENSWVKNYYEPLASRLSPFLIRHNHSESARMIVKEYEQEIEMYHRFKDYYSYGFYVARKN